MSATELLETSGHISECRSCRQLLSEAEQIQSRVGSLRDQLRSDALSSAGHVSYERVAAYVTGSSDDVESEIIGSHIEICSSCNEEVQDLREFHAERSAAARVAANRPVLTFFDRFKQTPFRFAFAFAGVAAAMLLIAWLATLPLRNQVTELRAKLDEAQRKNDELQTQASSTVESQPTVGSPEPTESDSRSALARALYDGGRIVILDKQGNVTGMQSIPVQVQQAVKAVVVNDQSGLSEDLRGIVGRTGVLMSGSSEGVSFALIGPVGTVVETDRPTFRWQPYGGATAYVVNVYDSSLKNVATSDRLSSTRWTSAPLKRGEVYTWQVTAFKDGVETTSPAPPAPEAKFKILDQPRVQEVSQFRNAFADSHLTLGALYKKFGLLDEAEREFEVLLSANPHSVLARKLLDDVKALRRK